MTVKRSWKNPGSGRWDEDLVVTPEIAAYWLEHCMSDKQSKVSQAIVERYAFMRREGLWDEDNDSPIKLDVAHEIIDGKHRCWMVVETDLPTRFHVHYNVPTQVYDTTDTGRLRGLDDVGSLAFHGNKRAAAVARAMAKGAPTSASLKLASCLPLMREFQDRHEEALRFTLDTFRSSKRGITSVVLGCAARAYYYIPRHELMMFADRLTTGRIDNEGESAALALRDWLTGAKQRVHKNGVSPQAETYLKTARAIELFVERKPSARIYAATEDPFPLPR